MPLTRARTSATRNAEMRPGRSCVSITGAGVIVSTLTSIGPPGPPDPAGGPACWRPQPTISAAEITPRLAARMTLRSQLRRGAASDPHKPKVFGFIGRSCRVRERCPVACKPRLQGQLRDARLYQIGQE